MNDLTKKVTRSLFLPWHDRLNSLNRLLVTLKTALYYRPVFGSVGRGCKIYKPLLLVNPRFVHLGDHSLIGPSARIEAIVLDEGRPPKLLIGSNVNIEQNVHLICTFGLAIGDNVSIGPSVSINDTVHPFLDLEDQSKIGDRIDLTPTPIEIGSNSLIGFGTAILAGVRIGKNCIIGANSTIRRDIPDFSVVSGNPATTVMRYDVEKKIWL